MPEERSQVARPDDLIPFEQMIPVIIDLQTLESHYQKRYQRANLYRGALDSASYFAFERHDVTKEQFERSYAYYSMDLQVMFLLLESTLDSINNLVNENNPELTE